MPALFPPTRPARFAAIVAAAILASVSILLIAVSPLASAAAKASPASGARKATQDRARKRPRRIRLQRAVRVTRVTRAAPLGTPAPDAPLVEAGCDNGLLNWSTAGVGEVLPTVVRDTVRTGSGSCRVALSGSEERSELILGGDGGDGFEPIEFGEGAEYWYGFSFLIDSMVYGRPGAHNLIMQFKSDGEGSPNFGLQLWSYAGDDGHSGGRGLWTTGDAMGGDRYLSPLSERQWHDVAIHFRASSHDSGFYAVYLDGQLVDSRSGVSMIVPGQSYAYIKNGLYRAGEDIPGSSEIRLDAARLGRSQTSVAPS